MTTLIPSHLSLTAAPVMLRPDAVPELAGRLSEGFSGKSSRLFSAFTSRKKKSSASPMAHLPDAPRLVPVAYTNSDDDSVTTNIAVISISGVLLNKACYLTDYHGNPVLILDGYDRVVRLTEAAVADPDIGGVFYDIDSLGGMVYSCFTASDTLAELSAVKPILAYTETTICSAAYTLASAATEIWGDQSAEIGSIGVVWPRYDVTKAMDKDGVAVTFTTSGTRKTYSNPETQMSEQEATERQAKVDHLAGQFFDRVAARRNISVDAVAELQAGVFITQDAIAHKIADGMGDRGAAMARLIALISTPTELPDADPAPAKPVAAQPAATSTSTQPKKDKPMSKILRAGVSGKLSAFAHAMASAALTDEESAAIDDEDLTSAIDEETDKEAETLDDEEVTAIDDEEVNDDDTDMMEEDDKDASAKSAKATASRISRAALTTVRAKISAKAAATAAASAAPAAPADAVAAAVQADRARASAIAKLPEAKGRESLAAELSAQGLSVASAKAALSAAPKADAGLNIPVVQVGAGGTPSASAAADPLSKVIEDRKAAKAGSR